ncbi:MAG: hypothetical protein DRI56_11560, partial [Chloroflexota bacterium]
ITEKLCGTSVSSTQVSKATAKLDETLEAWRNRSLGIFRYIRLDARYEKVRQGGHIQDAAVLVSQWCRRRREKGYQEFLRIK